MPKLDMKSPNDHIEHSGVLGMHWGERRYQNYDGSLTEEGRKHYGIGRPRMSKAEKLEMRQKKQEERQEKKAEAIRKKKEKIYIRGNADEIYKNRKLFTTEEYQKAMQRAQEFTKYEEAKKQKNAKPVKPAKVDDGKMHAFQLYTGDAETAKGVDKKKQAIINSGDPKLVRKNLSKLNDQELRSALEHIKGRTEIDSKIPGTKEYKDLEKAVKDRAKVSNGKSAINTLIDAGSTATKFASVAMGMYSGYNQMASMVNELSGDNKLPVYNPITWGKDQKNKGKDNSKNDGKSKENWGNGNIHAVSYHDLGNYETSNAPLAFGTYTKIGNKADISTFSSGPKWDNKMTGTPATFANALYEASDTPISTFFDENPDWNFEFD